MKLVFAGTPEFAARALSALLASRHLTTLVLTQPDRAAGRGLKLQASPVKRLASQHGIPVAQPATLKDPAAQAVLRTVEADLMVVVAYGLLLPQAALDIPRLGAVNVHASLLPRWRGAAPIQRALLAGDATTGVSIMQMDAGLDTGPVLLAEPLTIRDDDTAQTLHDRLAELGAKLLVQALDRIEAGTLQAQPQPSSGATYAAKIDRSEARIDWSRSATEVWRKVRALNPYPGALTRLAGTDVKIWRAGLSSARGAAGSVLESGPRGIVVACGEGSVRIDELQRAGGRRLATGEYLSGHGIKPGERFEN